MFRPFILGIDPSQADRNFINTGEYARLAEFIGAGSCRFVRLAGVIAFASRYRPSPGRAPLRSEYQKRPLTVHI